jgi:hypothetical protein
MSFSTYSDLKDSIRAWLGRPGDPLIPTADLVALFEADASRSLRTHYQEVHTDITTISGTAAYDLPDDFLAAREVKITSTTPVWVLEYLAPAQLDETWISTTSGQPFNYTIEESSIRFGPIPAGVYTVRVQYWQAIPALADTSYAATAISAITAAGTGYSAGDTLIVSGGDPAELATLLTVDTVLAGAIQTAHVSEAGDYQTAPANPVQVTGGTGSGATFNLTYTASGGSSNWLLDFFPDAYLWGSLAEAELFLGADNSTPRFQMFLQRREAAYAGIRLQDRRFKLGGAPLCMKTDTGNP